MRSTSTGDHGDAAGGTLGDLLYPDRAHQPVTEADWVGLVTSIAAGDQRALHVLYERTHRLVFTLTLRMTNNRAAAEELTVDVFHDVWRRASTFDASGGSVVGWIMNQARSRAIDRLRYEHRKKRLSPEGNQALPDIPYAGPDKLLEQREGARLLRQALDELDPHEREAIHTAFFSELTYHEAAARLNRPVGTVKTRIRTGLAKLRQALAKPVSDP